MELVPRDLDIMDTVGQLGTAETGMIRERHFPRDKTGRACQQRLRKLANAGLLKRVRLVAVDDHVCNGSLPALFFLTPAGGDLVEREIGQRPPRVMNSDPKPFTLRHRITTVEARIAIDRAAALAGIDPPEWIMEQDCRPGHKAGKAQSPSDRLLLNNRYQVDGRTVSFRPDAACHIQLPNGDQKASLLAYFEVDRSTEAHFQWNRKLRGLEAFLADPKGWQAHWPNVINPRVRVLVLCKSQQRLANLLTTTHPSPAATRIWMATYPLDPAIALTGPIWFGCGGLDEPPAAIIRNK